MTKTLSNLLAPRSNLLAPRTLLALLLLAGAAEADEASGQIPLTSNIHELENGSIYKVEGRVDITGKNGQSALTVKSKTVAYINLVNNAKLYVTGGAGDGMTPGGAGIQVEEGAKLYITGDGEVTAIGGNAGNGASGANGSDANYNTTKRCEILDAGSEQNHGVESYWGVLGNGEGGAGGNGGGGAGAGIGGAGGMGGAGGKAGDKTHFYGRHNDKRYMHTGADGGAGTNGTAGAGMGTVIVTGTVRLRATGGAAGSRGARSGSHGRWYATKNSSALNLYTAVGGAGGGSGDGGRAAAGIGGGGGGGGGGGAGGNGGHYLFSWWSDVEGYKGATGENYYNADYPFISGIGGNGGAPGSAGETRPGVKNIKYGENGSYHNGYGGNGGTTAGSGGAGSLYVSLRAGVDDKTGLRYGLPPAAQNSAIAVTVTFDGKPEKLDWDFTYMGKLPNASNLNPRRVGYRFAGWWTKPEKGNVCFYDRDGTPVMPYCDQIDQIDLVSKWEVDSSILTVNSTADGGDFLNAADKTVTLRAAVRALCDNPTLTGTNGARRIVFALPRDNSTVTLKSPIVVSKNVAPFEIFGLCSDTNGVFAVTLTCEKGRILEVNGDGISLSHLMLNGASASAAGGALLCNGSFLMIDDCSFIGNSATEGGAICARNGFSLMRGCTFAGNRASSRYGAVSGSGLTAAINCTFSENHVDVAKGMASAALGVSGDGLVAHCTFAGNNSSLTSAQVSNVTATVTAVNCIFADGPEAVNNKSKVTMLYSGETKPLDAFVGGGLPQTNNIYGVDQVWYEPRQCDDNYNAAMLLYDGYGVSSMITVKGVETNVLFGTAAEANIPILADQLRSVRFAPTRGAIRLISGENRPGVYLEGIYREGAGRPTNVTAVVTYDDKVVTSNKVEVTPNKYGFFGLNIPVEGSDGTTHNAVTVSVEALNKPAESMGIATMPYAFTASSSDVLVTGDGAGDDKDVVFPGDAVTANRVVADSVTVAIDGWLEVGSQEFSAGTVRGFGSIELAGIDITEGRLKILQDRNDQGVTEKLDYGNLKGMLPRSTEQPFANGRSNVTERLAAQVNQTVSTDFSGCKATGDGFLQLFVRVPAVSGARIGLKVGGLEVTPLGAFGADGRERRFLWTVPVRKGDVTKLTLSAGSTAVSADCLRQYMYFGVQSASDLDDEEK